MIAFVLVLGLFAHAAPALAAPTAEAPTAPRPFAELVDIDLVGDHPTATVTPAAWAALRTAAPGLAGADGGKDAVALRSKAHPKARKRVDVSLPTAGPAAVLLGWEGDAGPAAVLVRLSVTGTRGERTVDLKAGDVPAMGAGRIDDDLVVVDAGNGRTLVVVYLDDAGSVGIEARSQASVYVLGVAPGQPLRPPRGVPESMTGGFPFPLDLDTPAPPIPAEWKVPARAGSRGKVTVRDGHLAYSDGTRARFWGVNLLNAANYPTHELADRLAAHLADHGVNLVRMHHADSPKAGGLNPARKTAEEPLFSEEGLDRFDYLVSRLEAAGIYVLLEVATNRDFGPLDGVEGPHEDIPNGHKYLPMFQPSWKRAYLDWATAWLGRTNRYTGLRYADDPGVAMVELANEHTITSVWLTGAVERLPREHRGVLDARWNAFVRGRYPDDTALAAAWTGSVNPGLQPGETLGSIRREPSGQGNFQSWPARRVGDLYDFYVGLDETFFADVASHVRGLGYTQPLVPGITYDIPALARIFAPFDVVDAHIAWDHPSGGFRNEALVAAPRSQNLVEKFRVAQLGKPMMVSELGEPFPNDHVAEAPLLWATLASLQDWDVLVWFDYANGPIEVGPGPVAAPTENRFATVKWGQMAMASGLFRSGAVAPATGLAPQWRTDAMVKADTVAATRPSLTGSKDVRVPLSARIREVYGGAPPLPVPGEPSPQVGWWPAGSRMVVQTERLEAVLGDHFLRSRAGQGEGTGPTRAAHLDAELDGPAAVSLLCQDGPVARCKKGLLTVAGRMENEGMLRLGGGQLTIDNGGVRSLMKRPAGRVRFAWPQKPVLRPLDADGKAGEPVPVVADGDGWWSVPMESAGPTLWWRIG